MKRALLGPLLLTAFLGFWFTWAYDLWAPDEPFFGEGAREMVRDGRWVVPHVNGVVNTHKPPLFFWLIALVSLPFGNVSSWTARLPSMLAALGTLALTVRLGRRFWGERTAGLAGLVLAVTYLPWDKSRTAQIDATLCFTIVLALSAFEAYRAGDAGGYRAGLLFWCAAALGTLAKGPVAVLLPVGIALLTLAWDRRMSAWRSFAPLSGPFLFLAVTGSWIAVATIFHGEVYSVWGALREHFIDRAIQGMHHVQPPWYYAKVLPLQLMPWSALVPGALWFAWKGRGDNERFLLVWTLFVVVFFSISTEKRDLYVLPAYPAVALLVGTLIGRVVGWVATSDKDEPRPGRRWVTVPQGVTGAAMILVGPALIVVARSRYPEYYGPGAVLGAIFALGGTAVLATCLRGRVLGAVRITVATMAAVYIAVATLLLPLLNPLKSGRYFAQTISQETAISRAAGHPVPAFGLGNLAQSFAFYSDGVYLKEIADPAGLAAHLATGEQVFAVIGTPEIGPRPPEPTQSFRVVAETRLSRRHVRLITNR